MENESRFGSHFPMIRRAGSLVKGEIRKSIQSIEEAVSASFLLNMAGTRMTFAA